MQNQAKTLSVVFFDICNYSSMNLSNQLRCVGLLESGIRNNTTGGHSHAIVEGGDSFALSFDNLEQAVEFAINIAKHLKTHGPDIFIRTGIYTGEVLIRKSINDVFNMYGVGIDYAARLASCCAPGQILVAAHSFDEIAPRNSPLQSYANAGGKYRVKHGVEIDVYNLYAESDDGFGVSELPLKGKVEDSSFLIIVGDRREVPPNTVGDLFHAAPSIDDLCHVFKFDWPDDVLLRGDKIMCWAKSMRNSIVTQRNLFVIGSPKVNIASLMINFSSIFRFRFDDIYKDEIEPIHRTFTDSPPNDVDFLRWYAERRSEIDDRYPSVLSNFNIDDPLRLAKSCVKSVGETYGFVSFAAHPLSDDPKRYSIVVAGIDLCATLTITGNFFKIDFSDHPLGGVLRIRRTRKKERPWYEDPHYGELSKDEPYWVTPSYDFKRLIDSLDNDRKNFVNRLSKDLKLSMSRIQTFLKKK